MLGSGHVVQAAGIHFVVYMALYFDHCIAGPTFAFLQLQNKRPWHLDMAAPVLMPLDGAYTMIYGQGHQDIE